MMYIEKYKGISSNLYIDKNQNLGTSSVSNTTIEILKTHMIQVKSSELETIIKEENNKKG